MKEIDVSIIIPVFNVEPYICECLESVISQTTKSNLECLIIDDKGSDNSIEIAKKIISTYNGPIDFRIITRTQNGGLSAARNTGIKEANGRYIYFLDSDDVITPDCIELLLTKVYDYQSAEIVIGDFQTFPQKDIYKSLSLQGKKFPIFSDDIKWIRSVYLKSVPVISCNKLIERSFILKNNLYFKEGIIHEDNHWQAQTYHFITGIAFVNKVTYLYRIREGSITTHPNSNTRKLENLGKIYQEMFSKDVECDKHWAEWICNSLSVLKFSSRFSQMPQEARRLFSSLTRILFKNKRVPLKLRLLFLYWGSIKHYGQDRLFYFLFQQLNH